MKINKQEKEALTGFHAVTGNDYIVILWKMKMQMRGNCPLLFTDIEEYICAI